MRFLPVWNPVTEVLITKRNDSYFGHSIFKAGPEVLEEVRIMNNVQSNYNNIRLLGKGLLNHYDVY